jgi:chromosome segregation ATPase
VIQLQSFIYINQHTILNKLNFISCKEKQDQEKSDVENSTKYQEIVKIKDDLYKQIQVLQKSLQKARHECSLKEAELDHKLRTEKNKTIQIQQTNNELLKSLEHQIEIKQQVINSTNTSLDDIKLQCKTLEKDLESAQSEII